MLLGENGLAVCCIVRPHYMGPVLMLMVRNKGLEQVLGLEMGEELRC
jgi:two-component system response regulator RstA